MGRSLRTRWDLLKPDLEKRVSQQQSRQKEYRDKHSSPRAFSMGQSVMVKNFRSGPDWLPGEIVQLLGPLTYLVDVGNGRFWKRHVDHLKDYALKHLPETPNTELESEIDVDITPSAEAGSAPSVPEVTPTHTPTMSDTAGTTAEATSPAVPPMAPTRRYPVRDRRPPDRYA